MDQLVIPKVSDAVRRTFEPVMKALGPVRRTLAQVKDVVTVRPGYSYPDNGKPVPALVVAVTPGTAPVKADELENRFDVAFTVTDATVEEQLAIPGYDALSASQVVERLAGLSGDELAAVRRYETGHRRRRTILGKIEQLSS